MLTITDEELQARMRFDNPWWDSGVVPEDVVRLAARDYFAPFEALVRERSLRRAVVLLGPRRVGKTILMQQVIDRLLRSGHRAQDILFISLDTPLFSGLPLEKLLNVYMASYGTTAVAKTVFFDEIQYLKDWEVHLKSLVDSYRDIKFVVSGSAAAALARGTRESGAGRFTEFLLPPLTFSEYLRLTGDPLAAIGLDAMPRQLADLNRAFVDYLNFGGYPELATSAEARRNPARYVGRDIVEKVLLRDLPSLYGISDVQELQHLFKVLAFNTGQEVSLEGLSNASSVSKNTLKRYIEYLEAAFLVRCVERIDVNAERFQRNRHFKVYLTNPCLRTALFGPVGEDDDIMGALAETAVFAQWFHDPEAGEHIRYVRDRDGEIDIVSVQNGDPAWTVEIKWTDRFFERPGELKYLLKFARRHGFTVHSVGGDLPVRVTTRRKSGRLVVEGVPIEFVPTSILCLSTGRIMALQAAERSSAPVVPEDDGQAAFPF